jgi:hypothetical protein
MTRTSLTILLLATISLTAYPQFNQVSKNHETTDTEIIRIGVAYRLFPTENIWTFIKLNTRTGQMSQAQFDVEGTNRHETFLNLLSLVAVENEFNDRFTLYPTQNINTFILLDQLDGRTWQVQWSLDRNNRVIIPIE